MKIFDWVHRCFHNDSNSSSISLCEDGAEKHRISIKSESKYSCEKEALLVPSNLDVNTIDNWKLDDILTIGTLAICPLETLGQQDEIDIVDVDCVEKNVISEYLVFDDGDYKDLAPLQGNKTLEPETVLEDTFHSLKLFQQDLRSELKCKEMELLYDFSAFAAEEEDLKKDQKNGGRVTLAELFMAKHDLIYFEGDPVAEDAKLIPSKKETSGAKKDLSKAKNLLKDDVHPLKKFKNFMKRILKKKVHPELMGKKDDQGDNGVKSPSLIKQSQYAANNESAPLLLVLGTFSSCSLLDFVLKDVVIIQSTDAVRDLYYSLYMLVAIWYVLLCALNTVLVGDQTVA
ncbi:TILLER ANGLE CONTROL 1-like protein [Drosera capensis]